jgi:hypothetical protein
MHIKRLHVNRKRETTLLRCEIIITDCLPCFFSALFFLSYLGLKIETVYAGRLLHCTPDKVFIYFFGFSKVLSLLFIQKMISIGNMGRMRISRLATGQQASFESHAD